MSIDHRDPNSRLASRLTIVSYPAEIIACLLPELNGVRDQLNQMPLIQEDGRRAGTLDQRIHRFEQDDKPGALPRLRALPMQRPPFV